MTSLLERFGLVWRISRSGAKTWTERNINRHRLSFAQHRDSLETTTSGRGTNRFIKLSYLAIQIALFILQSGPSACGQQKAFEPETLKPALALLGSTSTIGDFDGDRRLDHAEFHQAGAHRCIRLRFGTDSETHLLFNGTFAPGTLVATDVNNDHKPDLLWIFHYKLIPAVIWIGDGLGHFARSTSNEDLHALIFGYPGARIAVGDSRDLPPSLTNSPTCLDLLCATNLNEIHHLFVSIGSNRRRDLGLYLSNLRERGPPPFFC